MKKLLLPLALLLSPSAALAACTGIFAPGGICGSLTGGPPIEIPSSSITTLPGPNSVTNSMLAQMQANSFKCNPGSSSANALDCTMPTLNAALLGAKGDNSTDNTSTFNSIIIPLAGTLGAKIYVPAGVYRISGTLTLPTGVSFECDNRSNTTIRTTSVNADVFSPNGASVVIRHCTIDSSVTRSGGYYINPTTNVSTLLLEDLVLNAPFFGIHIPNIATVTLRDVYINSTVATSGESIVLDGGFAVLFDHVFCTMTTAFSHLVINNVADLTINDSQFIGSVTPVQIIPSGGGNGLGLLLTNNTQFDAPQGGNAIRIAPGTGAVVNRVFIHNAWINQSSPQSNVIATNAGGGTINGLTVTNSIFIGNGSGNGLDLTGVTNVNLSGSHIGGHATAVSISSSNNVRVRGNILGPSDAGGANSIGVFLGGTSDFYNISGNDISGNTTAISNSASGTNGYIGGNVGYPTIGATGITVGASPFTYTAGPSPETVCVNAGTVSLISISGVGALQSTAHCIPIGPNQALTVTYSALPSMIKSINR